MDFIFDFILDVILEDGVNTSKKKSKTLYQKRSLSKS